MSMYTVHAIVIPPNNVHPHTHDVPPSSPPNVIIDLGGTWNVRNANGSISINATVPGAVHTDLLSAKVIPDPYFGYNDVLLEWVFWDNWTYSTTFTLPSGFVSLKQIILECDGLDTISDVHVNGRFLGSTNNQFLQYKFNVSNNVLNVGQNNITIKFTSAPAYAQAKADAYPYAVPTTRFPFDKPSRNFIRKEQCSFGWDWGPMFATQGIWLPIRLVGVSDAIIDEVEVQTYPATRNLTAFTVKVNVFVSAALAQDVTVHVSVAGANASSNVSLRVGENVVPVGLIVHNPNLWWPNGYGAHPLYTLTVNLNLGGSIISVSNKTIGFRSVEIIQEPASEDGLTFYFKVNGVPIFAKGANWIPADAFESRVTYKVLEDLLQSSVDANMNIIRNWGGGIYQHQSFYEIADRLGLMVWEEFMFACSMYPRDAAFLDNIAQEIKYQIKRLSHHVSIVLWSGNNENEVALTGWYEEVRDNAFLYATDYAKLYLDTIYPVVKAADPSRPFWPSSPSNGFISEKQGLVTARWGNPGSSLFGDVHYYNSDADCSDVSFLPSPRFTSEYGFQAFPSIFAWQQVAPSASDFVFNGTFSKHREHGSGGIEGVLLNQMKIHFTLPNNASDPAQFENYIYLSQCMQALCIKSESEHYRRSKAKAANTMGAIYWQLNDIWQGPTWSSIEYGGRWKLLHYYVRNFFAPVLVSAYEFPPGNLSIAVTSDENKVVSGVVVVSLYSYDDGKLQNSFNVSFNLQSLGSMDIFVKPIPSLLSPYPACSSASRCFVTVVAVDKAGNTLSRNVKYLSSLAQVKLPVPTITWGKFNQVSPSVVSFVLTSTQVAPYTFLQTKLAGVFSDNGFLLLPNTPLTLLFVSKNGNVTAADLSATLSAKSVANTY